MLNIVSDLSKELMTYEEYKKEITDAENIYNVEDKRKLKELEKIILYSLYIYDNFLNYTNSKIKEEDDETDIIDIENIDENGESYLFIDDVGLFTEWYLLSCLTVERIKEETNKERYFMQIFKNLTNLTDIYKNVSELGEDENILTYCAIIEKNIPFIRIIEERFNNTKNYIYDFIYKYDKRLITRTLNLFIQSLLSLYRTTSEDIDD